MRIATAVSSQLAVPISPLDMFNHPTVASLSEWVAAKLEGAQHKACGLPPSRTYVITAQPSVIDSVMVPLGSITKTITAIGILRLADRGLLSLNQPIHEFLPWFKPTSVIGSPMKAIANPITISHLLLHQSGIGYGVALSSDSDLVDQLYDMSSLSPQSMPVIVAQGDSHQKPSHANLR